MKLEVSAFEGLCEEATVDDLARLVRRARSHANTIEEAALEDPDLPVELALALADRLQALSEIAGDLSSEHRRLVRGVMSYFILTTDDENDLGGPNGLDDDVTVLNTVCERIGRADLKLKY